ncbi:MAG: extracellular solute-binding protein [Natronomonas sp.]
MRRGASRRAFLGGLTTTLGASAAGCLGADSGSGTLRIIDWGYVYNDGVIEEFEDRHDVTVEIQSAQGSAETLTQLREGRAEYDIAPLGNYAVKPAMDEGLIQPLDLDRIPSYDEVFDFLKMEYFESDGQVFGVPRSFGQTPLAVNTELVDRDVTALADLWDEDLAGVVGGRDDARLQVLYRNAAVGTDLNPTAMDDVDFEALREDLIDRLNNTAGLWGNGGESEQLLRTEEVGVQPVWNYVIQAMEADGMPIERVFPEEGTKAWFIQYTVRDGAENPDLAHQFIEEWHSEMGYRSLMEPNNIAVPNERVFEEQDLDRSILGLDDPEQFIYEEPKPPELVEAYSETWSEAKTQADG